MTNPARDPVCLQDRKDCNRNKDGFCVLLRDTKFNKPCPFYKKAEKGEKK